MNLRHFSIGFGVLSILLMILAVIERAMIFGRMTPFILTMAILGSVAMFAISFISSGSNSKEEQNVDGT